jgi:hypothetical protein
MPHPEIVALPTSPHPRRRRWIWFVGAAGAIIVVLLLLAIVATVPFSSVTLRQRVIATLSDRLVSDVELDGLELRLLPRFHVDGYGLRIRLKGRRDGLPLIKVDTLTVEASLANLLRKHVNTVKVTGLEINITHDTDRVRRSDANQSPGLPRDVAASQFVIDELTTTGARLVIIPTSRDKPPRAWEIHRLRMQSLSFERAMPFEATLTNAIPPGEIQTQGSFGPWMAGTPEETPLDGTFRFANADLSFFKGIGGILSAHGEFGGTLGKLGVHGETDTPQFTVAVSGHPVPLHADYHTTVDGTNGDTLLDRIDASFLKTALVAKGSVVGKRGQEGRTVTLDVDMTRARVEDVLRLAVKAPTSPMTGAMKLKTRLVLPPGDRDVVDKLRLDGQFEIGTVRFTSLDIQKRVDELSRRSRGTGSQSDGNQSSVVSDFSGRFKLGGGSLMLSTLTFSMPGTQVQLAGTYTLRSQLLDFTGTLLMDAKISETQKGWKRLALKVLDPLFASKGGRGSAIPIKIQGKRTNPAFGLDARALFRRHR